MSRALNDSGSSIERVATPCLIVDRSKMERNVDRLRTRLTGLGVLARPHLKTVKSYEATQLALSKQPNGPATVSTLKEAEEFGRRGIADLLYAVCLSPQKLDRVTAIRRSGVKLSVVVDSIEMAERVAAHARESTDPIETLIEIDADGHRSGVCPDQSAALIAIARSLHEGGACFRGVMAHAGESYRLSDPRSLADAAENERLACVTAAETLRSAGLPCPVVSIGSTPTVFSAESLEGVTEVRAGVYMFFDLYQAGVGVCSVNDIAVSVLATVIGHKKEKGWIIVDAGWMALSCDRSTARQKVDQHFGVVCDVDGVPFGDLVLLKANQEHGVVARRPPGSGRLPRLNVGDRVRILPNHACATAAQHDKYQIVEGERTIREAWTRFRGW